MGLGHCFFPESQLAVVTSAFLFASVLVLKGSSPCCSACFVAAASQQSFGAEAVRKLQEDQGASRGLFRMLSCLWLLP